MVSLSTIVFHDTLTRLIGGIADAIATRNSNRTARRQEQVTLITSYLFGRLLAVSWPYRKERRGVSVADGVAVALVAHPCFASVRAEARIWCFPGPQIRQLRKGVCGLEGVGRGADVQVTSSTQTDKLRFSYGHARDRM